MFQGLRQHVQGNEDLREVSSLLEKSDQNREEEPLLGFCLRVGEEVVQRLFNSLVDGVVVYLQQSLDESDQDLIEFVHHFLAKGLRFEGARVQHHRIPKLFALLRSVFVLRRIIAFLVDHHLNGTAKVCKIEQVGHPALLHHIGLLRGRLPLRPLLKAIFDVLEDEPRTLQNQEHSLLVALQERVADFVYFVHVVDKDFHLPVSESFEHFLQMQNESVLFVEVSMVELPDQLDHFLQVLENEAVDEHSLRQVQSSRNYLGF